MAELQRPTTYVGKLELAQRMVKAATYRTDPKLAVRELCEAIAELTAALLERELKGAASHPSGAGGANSHSPAPPPIVGEGKGGG